MKQLRGVISSLPGMNTARVSVSRQWTHPLYKKSVKRTKNYSCHYEDLKLQVGDEVLIQACRPMSKTKRFLITTVVTMETKS